MIPPGWLRKRRATIKRFERCPQRIIVGPNGVGICGAHVDGHPSIVCQLDAGHAGWHRDGETNWGQMSWTA